MYGLTVNFKALDESGPLTIAALNDGTVQAGDIFTTDPSVTKYHFVALSDPKDLFSAQNVIPIINKSVATSTVTNALELGFGRAHHVGSGAARRGGGQRPRRRVDRGFPVRATGEAGLITPARVPSGSRAGKHPSQLLGRHRRVECGSPTRPEAVQGQVQEPVGSTRSLGIAQISQGSDRHQGHHEVGRDDVLTNAPRLLAEGQDPSDRRQHFGHGPVGAAPRSTVAVTSRPANR